MASAQGGFKGEEGGGFQAGGQCECRWDLHGPVGRENKEERPCESGGERQSPETDSPPKEAGVRRPCLATGEPHRSEVPADPVESLCCLPQVPPSPALEPPGTVFPCDGSFWSVS